MVRLRVHLLGERINRSDSGRRDASFLQRHLGGVKGIDAVGKREFPDGKLGCVHRDIRLERCLVAADGKSSSRTGNLLNNHKIILHIAKVWRIFCKFALKI